MSRSMTIRAMPYVAMILVLAGIGFACYFFSGRRETSERPQTPKIESQSQPSEATLQRRNVSVDYAGSQTCVECHSEIDQKMRMHPMGRSLAKTVSASPMEIYGEKSRFTTPITPGTGVELSYFVEQKESEVIHHEIATGIDGDLIYDLAVPVEFAIGSGQRGRSYLVNHDGFLFMSPITWYSQKQRWDLSPGYQNTNAHFGRRILDGCIQCHSGRINAVGDFPDHFQPEPFAEESISCERCHGPSNQHVAYRSQGGTELALDPIVKIRQLDSTRQNHLCFECHLIGESRITRAGCTDFDFRPGDHVQDIWTIAIKEKSISEDGTTEAVNQVGQMLASQCYKKSNGTLKCVTCHNPHSRPADSEMPNVHRENCLKCHGENSRECSESQERRRKTSPADSCIECHMPKLQANDVPHTSQTDHRVLRKPSAAKSTDNSKTELSIFDDVPGTYTPGEIERAQALTILKTMTGKRGNIPSVEAIPKLERWLKTNPSDIDAIDALGRAYSLIRDEQEAMAFWERGLRLNPKSESLLRQLLVLCQETRQIDKGILYGRRLVELNPWDYEYLGRLSHLLGQANELDEACEMGERALKLNPMAFHINEWLAMLYERKGNVARSQFFRNQHAVFLKARGSHSKTGSNKE